MAKCPGCNGDVRWDWCADTFEVDQVTAVSTELHNTNGRKGSITSMQCPECLTILGVIGATECGEVHEHPAFKGISWEDDENTVQD